MTREQVCSLIEECGIVPAVRVAKPEDARFAFSALHRGGIPIMELTMTVPGAVDLIPEFRSIYPDLVMGAGTVFDVETAEACLDAGALFITSPGFDPAVVEFCHKRQAAVLPGALTPTEVMLAAKMGADFVKIFPCSHVGGPAYIKALKAPFPHVRMIAAGGVTQHTATDFIRAGASALGIGEDLIPPDAIEQRDEHWIRELSQRFLVIVKRARSYRN
jgi:2-dehydro-3-deoxyphosphogluconate aldolase/(4S)-4-hydroxy-2-oxoglutarate aldolase